MIKDLIIGYNSGMHGRFCFECYTKHRVKHLFTDTPIMASSENGAHNCWRCGKLIRAPEEYTLKKDFTKVIHDLAQTTDFLFEVKKQEKEGYDSFTEELDEAFEVWNKNKIKKVD